MSVFGHTQPLQAISGSFIAAAASANQALTDLAGEGLHGYLTRLKLIPRVIGAGANTISLLDKSGGTVRWKLDLAAALVVGVPIDVVFETPVRTADVNGQFFITTTGALFTWGISYNGYIK